jgi:hypothetical protein
MNPPGSISDRDVIRNTIARNNQYLDDRRYEDCARTFAEDGSIAGHQGRTAILEFMHSQGLGANPQLQRRHVVTNIAIDVAGDVAQRRQRPARVRQTWQRAVEARRGRPLRRPAHPAARR